MCFELEGIVSLLRDAAFPKALFHDKLTPLPEYAVGGPDTELRFVIGTIDVDLWRRNDSLSQLCCRYFFRAVSGNLVPKVA